jgi:hypothetical protein
MAATLEYKEDGADGWVLTISDETLAHVEQMRAVRMIPNPKEKHPPFVPEFDTRAALVKGIFEGRLLKPALKLSLAAQIARQTLANQLADLLTSAATHEARPAQKQQKGATS